MKAKPFTIAVVEDNEWYNKLLVHTLSLNPDFHVLSYADPVVFLKQLEAPLDVVTLDLRLPGMSGKELFDKLRKDYPETEVIIISEQEDIQTAIDLLKSGAYDYIVKEKNIRERLFHTIDRIRNKNQLIRKIEVLENEVRNKYDLGKTIIGSSTEIQNVLRLIEKTLENNITVMINGETGTGKEVVAKAIHYNSLRSKHNFVVVNVAAIPGELMESELFGHEKGSFTGANNRRIGKFEEANGGTLFLDEIGDLDISLQAKLLRALQEKEIVRIGSNTSLKADCRIIAATHRNLQDLVKRGLFREDLFYRLMGFPIELPPLRTRGKDILMLAKHFIDAFCKENKLSPRRLSEDAKHKLLSYPFPGNVRELRSAIELAVVMTSNEEISATDITFISEGTMPDLQSDGLTLRQYQLKILAAHMKKYNNEVKLVSRKLDIGQATIYRMLKEINGE